MIIGCKCRRCGLDLEARIKMNKGEAHISVDTGCLCKEAPVDTRVRQAFLDYENADDGHARYAQKEALLEAVAAYVGRRP